MIGQPDPCGASSATAEDATAESAVTVGSLCSGYGGLDLGLALGLGVQLRHAWHVEYDKHPSDILAHRFPGVPNYGDVKLAPWHDMEPVDWLTAGYPCQPFSLAGLRKGADDPRHLWPGVARAIGVLRPRRVLLENVAAHLRDGFDVVLSDLARMGYDASWGVVRASDAGAPHGRARLFVVARNTDGGHEGEIRGTRGRARADAAGVRPVVAEDTDSSTGGERRLAAPGQAQGGWARADIGGRGGASAPDTSGPRLEGRWPLRGGGPAAQPSDCRSASPDADRASVEALNGRPGSRDAGRLQPVVCRDPAGDVSPAVADAEHDGQLGATLCGSAGTSTSAGRPLGFSAIEDGQPAGGHFVGWGAYGPAIARWEAVIGRAAPRPTELGRTGERLSPRFVEWLMGLPAGWVTDVPGLPRNAQLKALGNGVVPQQAALALRLLLPTSQEIAA